MQTLGQSWLVYRLTDSAFLLGLVTVIGLLPVVPVSLVAGVINDRFSKRRVLLVANTVLALLTALLALAIWYDVVQIWHIILFSFGVGVAYAFEQPAHLAMIHELVGAEDIPNAFALDASVRSATRLIGPLVAGVLIATFGEATAFTLNALSFAPLILLLFTLPDSVVTATRTTLGASVLAGFRYIWTNRKIAGLLVTVASLNFFTLSFMTLLPAFADDVLGTNAVGLGYLMGAAGGGAIVGALIVAAIRSNMQTQLLTAATIAAPFLLIAFAFAQSLPTGAILIFAVSVASTIAQSTAASQLQINTAADFQGRVMSIFFIVFSGASRVGALAIGAAAEFAGISLALAAGAVVGLVNAVLLALWTRVLRQGARQREMQQNTLPAQDSAIQEPHVNSR